MRRLQTSALFLAAALAAAAPIAFAANNVGEMISSAGASVNNAGGVPFSIPSCVLSSTPSCRLLLQCSAATRYRTCETAAGCTVDKTAPRLDELIDAGPAFAIPWFPGHAGLAIAGEGSTSSTCQVLTERIQR